MTTPQQPQRTVDYLHALTGDIAANNLASALIENNLGKQLYDTEIATVLTFVSGIEKPRQQAAANVPAFTPAGQQHDQAQQQ